MYALTKPSPADAGPGPDVCSVYHVCPPFPRHSDRLYASESVRKAPPRSPQQFFSNHENSGCV